MYDVEKTALPGVIILTPKVFADDRGFFMEAYNEKSLLDALKETGIEFRAVQENHIMNACPGVIRGLHFQNHPHAQAKLVRCIRGVVDDVAVDLRKGSPTYLRWVMVELSEENRKQLFLPQGFAHGVISRSEYSEVSYIVDQGYSPETDRNIRFDEPAIGVDWRTNTPVLSPKDRNAPSLAESDCNFIY